MEIIRIEILNPKAKSILKGLADLNLISIKKEKKQSEFMDLLTDLRMNSDLAPSLEEITGEVESVRKDRYEN
jgi:trehalose-6-phosphate synthase